MKIEITDELIRVEEEKGIVIFKNPEIEHLSYFALAGDEDKLIPCPDGRKTFDAIDVHTHVVCCWLPQKDGRDKDSILRIFLKETNEWLINPENSESKYDFYWRPVVDEEFIHARCSIPENMNRVFVFSKKRWIAAPNWEFGSRDDIKHFKEVKIVTFQEAKCLELKNANDLNPVSLYFIYTGEFLCAGRPPYEKNPEAGGVAIFHKIFSKYAVIATARGVIPTFYYLWRLSESDYFSVDRSKNFYEEVAVTYQEAFREDLFTEDHVGVRVNKNGYQLFSTETWEPIEVNFSYEPTSSEFENISLEKDGSIKVCIPAPKYLSKYLKK